MNEERVESQITGASPGPSGCCWESRCSSQTCALLCDGTLFQASISQFETKEQQRTCILAKVTKRMNGKNNVSELFWVPYTDHLFIFMLLEWNHEVLGLGKVLSDSIHFIDKEILAS